MQKIVATIIGLFIIYNSEAQRDFGDYIDSVVGVSQFVKHDWAVSFYKSGSMEFDSLGNMLPMPDYGNTIVISSINNLQYMQIFKRSFDENNLHEASARIKLPDSLKFNYTSDSISQIGNEYIYPYIYKNENNGTYTYQEPSDHSYRYSIGFNTKDDSSSVYFTENSFVEKFSFLPNFAINLNYYYNTHTFIYRLMLRIEKLLKINRRILLIK